MPDHPSQTQHRLKLLSEQLKASPLQPVHGLVLTEGVPDHSELTAFGWPRGCETLAR